MIVCKSGTLSYGMGYDFLSTVLKAKEQKRRFAADLPNSRLRVQLFYPNGSRVSKVDIKAVLRALSDEKVLSDVEKRLGARAAQPLGAQASAAGAFSAVCTSSKFSSGGVVAPQIGLNHETHARKSHG